jgi:putative transposase
VSKAQLPTEQMAAAAIRTVFAQPSPVHVRDQPDTIAAMPGRQFPKVEAMLREAADDITVRRLPGQPSEEGDELG